MPYKIDSCGIYKIVNMQTGQCYVGQSQHVKKRLKEHFRLLRRNKHTNQHLQNAYNKYGAESFYGSMEIECSSVEEMDALEEAFINGDAWFEEKTVYNIAEFAKAPMRNRTHSEEVRERIRLGRRACSFDFQSPEYRRSLSDAQVARFFADPIFLANLKFILDNPSMSYAERGRRIGRSTSSVRRMALKYKHLKGEI